MESTSYEPYGPEWEKELLRLPKNEIIRLFAKTMQSTAGVQMIAQERLRQIHVEGYTKEHDLTYVGDEPLAMAALCYLIPEADRSAIIDLHGELLEWFWPFDAEYWKPTPEDRVRELQKAGALVAAEIDRILAIKVVMDVPAKQEP